VKDPRGVGKGWWDVGGSERLVKGERKGGGGWGERGLKFVRRGRLGASGG